MPIHSSRHVLHAVVGLATAALVGTVAGRVNAGSFTSFESGQVRPMAISPDGKHLFVANTPDNRLEVFKIKASGLQHAYSVPVGLEPVAVAALSNDEVWVVNHLSDSVSVVDVSNQASAGVVRTLLVGDEPRDIVFAGPNHDRAFITTAHRGQNNPIDPQLTTPGVGRADVWVFETCGQGSSLGGTPSTILTLFGDTPRGLAVTPDGSRVYAAVFFSGNRTTAISQFAVPNGGEAFGGSPAPNTNHAGLPEPDLSLIVKFDGTHWVDEVGRPWDDRVKFSLPDKDVFVIDATAEPPVELPGSQGFYSGVGTVLYNMAVNPVSGKVYVSNTDANNLERFEGSGDFAGHSIRGHLAENRITVLDGAGAHPRHLNKHIEYDVCCASTPSDENERSLALPLDMKVSANGQTLYVAAFGSQKIGIFDTAALEDDTFVPDAADHVELSGGGPSGLVVDEARGRLYVLTRFDNSISVIDTASRTETGHLPMFNPEPASVVNGRRFLYDARHTSSHGDSACASCHVFGDLDALSWDLGDPDEDAIPVPGPFRVFTSLLTPPIPTSFNPMKGPMATQSLRGMANHGPMHWRGDRTGGNDAPSVQPDSGTFDEQAAFEKFNGAFGSLLGRDGSLPAAEMEAFTDFILQVTYPPNPIRALDNSLTPDQQAGQDIYFNQAVLAPHACNGCHVLDPQANSEYGVEAPGFFGTDGSYVKETGQFFKVPHLRNVYQKVGKFGFPFTGPVARATDFMGDQIRGFGVLHDGSVDTVLTFMTAITFTQSPSNPQGFLPGTAGDVQRRQIEQFIFAFDSNLAPIVGQQITLTEDDAAVVNPRIDLLVARANLSECDLVVKSRGGKKEDGYLYLGNGTFKRDRAGKQPIADAALRALADDGDELTYTCVPPGSGMRIALDRDLDGHLDGDERKAGSDPADPASTP